MFHLYGLLIGIAIVVGWTIAEKINPRVNKIALYLIIGGLIGARIYHVIDYWSYYSQNLAQIFYIWKGGLSIWGGLIAGAIIILMYDYRLIGAIVTGLPLAQAIGRIGNGVNGEFGNLVFGLPWWSVEMILDLLLYGLIYYFKGSTLKVGTYLVGYGLIRLVLQPYRL